MNINFANAMLAATELTRAQKPMEATRLIQGALLLGRGEPDSQFAPRGRAIENRSIEKPRVIDLTAEILEPETTTPEQDRQQSGVRAMGEVAAKFPGIDLPGFSLDGLAGSRPRKALTIPEGALFLSRSFDGPAGSRSYRLYVPHRQHAGKRGLLIMLHGGTQNGEDFAAGTRMNTLAEEHGLLVAYPNQTKAANVSLCWNWFHPEHQTRGAGEPAIIAGITSDIIAEFDVDPDRVFVAGLSAGGAMAAVMGATYPEVYAAIGIHSGLPHGSAADVASAFAAMRGDLGPLARRERRFTGLPNNATRVRTIVFHGDTDRIVHPANATKIVDAQARAGDSAERTRGRSAGRDYTHAVTRDEKGSAVIEQWLIHGSGHAWSGGSPDGSYTDPRGPDASREMLRFFLEEPPSTTKA